jgi:uncharacterized membrane protein
MKTLTGFLRATAGGGFFVLLPVMLLYLVLAEMLELVVALATPIADLFPKGTFDEAGFPVLAAIFLILGASFVIGLVMYSQVGRRLGRWVERSVLGRLPMYGALKRLAKGFAQAKTENAFRSAVLTSSQGDQEIVYIIEEHDDGQMTILVPWAPMAFAGPVKIVSRDKIEMLDANLGDVSKALSHWGVGVGALLSKGHKE